MHISVELVVDQFNKVWLNVNGICVFRAGCVDIVQVDDAGQITVLRTEPETSNDIRVDDGKDEIED